MVIANSVETHNSFCLNPRGSKQMFVVFRLIFNITLCCNIGTTHMGNKILHNGLSLILHIKLCEIILIYIIDL